MSEGLSILMPCYNNECYGLVADLSAQAESIIRSGRKLKYEVLVGDDGSTDRAVTEKNRRIDALADCHYIMRGRNTGRAAIRNFLARAASYDMLLFIDSDLVVRNPSFLSNYLALGSVEVACGGYTARGDRAALCHNLRYRYEMKRNRSGDTARRSSRPYHDFHTSNFLIRRDIMLAHPLDERFRRYGYEDVLFGKTLKQNGIAITHINNPMSFERYESNADFIAKTEQGIATLSRFRDDLEGYSGVLSAAARLDRLHLTPLFRAAFKVAARPIKNNLTGNNPSVLLLNIYKLGMFCSMKEDKT